MSSKGVCLSISLTVNGIMILAFFCVCVWVLTGQTYVDVEEKTDVLSSWARVFSEKEALGCDKLEGQAVRS